MYSNDKSKERICNLFSFIKEVKQLSEEHCYNDKEYDDFYKKIDSLPRTTYISYKPNEECLLSIKKPKLSPCPPPPKEYEKWLDSKWQRVSTTLQYHSTLLENKEVINLADYPEIQAQLQSWEKKREAWSTIRKKEDQILAIYNDFHKLKATLQDSDNKRELHWGEEHVSYLTADGIQIEHPLLYQLLEIESVNFHSEPEIQIVYASEIKAFYPHILQKLGLQSNIIQQCQTKLKEWNNEGTIPFYDFLREITHIIGGNFDSSSEKKDISLEGPFIYLESTIFLGKKETRIIQQITDFIEQIKINKSIYNISPAIEEIVSIIQSNIHHDGKGDDDISYSVKAREGMAQYYTTKPSNEEQEKIIHSLERNAKCINVQGPPGTGKSHTIANIIGHLLAKGKNVLVTAQKVKALQVIREQLIAELRPLCVNMLDNSKESKAFLDEAIEHIVDIISQDKDITKDIKELEEKKQTREKEIWELYSKIETVDNNEYTPISYQGEAIYPLSAGKFIGNYKENTLLPSPFSSEYNPLTTHISRLKAIISELSVREQNIILEIQDIYELLMSPSDFQKYNKYKNIIETYGSLAGVAELDREKISDIITLYNSIEIHNKPENYVYTICNQLLHTPEIETVLLKCLTSLKSLIESVKAKRHYAVGNTFAIRQEYELEGLLSFLNEYYASLESEDIAYNIFEFNKYKKILKKSILLNNKNITKKAELLIIIQLL